MISVRIGACLCVSVAAVRCGRSVLNHPVLSALIPVVLLVAIGFIAGRIRWIRAEGAKDLSNLVFLVLTPALMFRTMSAVQVQQIDPRPLAAYFAAALLLFVATLVVQGFNRRAAVLALAATFSNTVMIGTSLIQLAYGSAGLVILLTLVSLHALVLLTAGTVVLELAVAEHAAQHGHHQRHQQVLGQRQAFGPMALLLVGVTLAGSGVGAQLRGAFGLALAKNLLMPLMVAVLGSVFGLTGLPLLVMVVTAALPMGANVFLFSQRYEVAQEQVTAGVFVSNALALLTLPLVMYLAGFL